MPPQIGPDGHEIPEVQGVVGAIMAPIKPRPANAGESITSAVGVALDNDGNPICTAFREIGGHKPVKSSRVHKFNQPLFGEGA